MGELYRGEKRYKKGGVTVLAKADKQGKLVSMFFPFILLGTSGGATIHMFLKYTPDLETIVIIFVLFLMLHWAIIWSFDLFLADYYSRHLRDFNTRVHRPRPISAAGSNYRVDVKTDLERYIEIHGEL